MKEKINKLKKIIRYRLSYTGTKETDIIYQRNIINKIDYLTYEELFLLSQLFQEISDNEVFDILTNKRKIPDKYKELLKKFTNE